MNVLIGCEEFGEVRDAFRLLGHDAWSCDLEDVEPQGTWKNYHLFGDVRWFIDNPPLVWDLLIAFPPCDYLAVSGLHWNKRVPGRAEKTERALEFVAYLMNAPIPRIAIENPVGCISTRIRRPDQIFQPYEFGADASKKTCLWLKNLPPLRPTQYVPPRMVDGKPRWSNQTDSGQNRLGPSPSRARERGRTYPGVALAMALQWGT